MDLAGRVRGMRFWEAKLQACWAAGLQMLWLPWCCGGGRALVLLPVGKKRVLVKRLPLGALV